MFLSSLGVWGTVTGTVHVSRGCKQTGRRRGETIGRTQNKHRGTTHREWSGGRVGWDCHIVILLSGVSPAEWNNFPVRWNQTIIVQHYFLPQVKTRSSFE